MVIVNLLEFCCWARCYHGNQKTCWSKTWLYQVYLKIVFIYFWICYFCSADFVSGSNIQYPNVMSAPPFSQAENANIQETGVCFSGKLCERKVPETAFSCEVKRYVVSTRGDRSMPEWLWFNEENRTLVGIPSQKDEGILEILVVGLGHVPNSTQGYICGSSALKVTVRGLMHFPLFAVNPLLRAKPFHGNSNGGNTICGYNEPIVLASFVLPVKFHGLNGKERQTLLKILTSVYDVGIQDAFVLQNTVQNPFLGLLESSHVVASGPGMSGSTATELSTILTWHVKCGVIHVEDPLFEKLKQLSKKLFLTNNISHSVIGWHVITGFQRHYVQHRILRKRRNIIGGTTTPVYSSTIPISRETVVTTRLKPGRTSYITSTVLLTHLQPSPTFSLTFESTSSPGVSSSASIEHFSKRSPSLFSQHLNINSSSELTVTQNESPASQLSFSKLHTSFKSSLSSVLVKRSHTSTLMLPSMTTVSSNGYHRASSEPPLSSAMQLNTTATILSHITSRDTNITTHTLLIPSSHTLPLVTGNLFSSKTALSLQTSSSSFNKINTTPASTSVSSNSTKLLDFSKKSISTTVSNITVISSSPESRTHSTTPTTKEISSITKLTSGDKTTLVITTDQSVYPSSDGSATLDTFITSPSITSTRASSSFLQSYLKTSSLQLHTASSDDGIVSKSSTHEAVSSDRTTVSPQIKTVISFPTQSSTHNFSLASSDQTTTFLFTASQGHETITRQLTNDTSKSVSKSNTYRPSTLQSSKLVRTSSQALVTDKATFSRTISSISGKVSQLQTWIPSLSSTYHDGTTTVDYVSPVSESKKSILMSSVKSLFSPRIATGTMFPVNLTITTFITSAVTSKDRVTSPGSTSSVFARGITPSTTAPLIPTGERSRTTTRSLTSTVLLSSTFNTAVPVSQSLANNSTTTSLISPTEQLTSTFLFLSSERTSTSTSTQTNSGLAHVTTKYSILPTMTTSSSSMLPSSSIVSSPTTPPNSSPKLYNSFDLLSIQVGKVFNVQIPVDTFHDREDGNTRNLILSCLDGNHNPLSRDSWLQFNSTTQMLYGIILKSQVEQVKTSSEYLLVARDREGNKAYDAFTISVRENDQPLVVKYTLKIVGIGLEKFNQDLNNILLLVKKIAIYYGDEDASFVGVMSVDDGSVLFSWSNTTIRTCNLNLINELSSKIITTDGNIQPAFHNTLLPTFIVEDIHENKTGSCIPSITTEMPKVARLSSHDNTLWLKYFLPGLVVAILILIVAVTCFIVRRHSGVKVLKVDKQTFKRRKPIILDDELEMSTFSGKPVILPDDSLTPIRFPEETPVRITDEEDFPLWFSPVPSAPRYQRPPPSYKRTGDASGYRTPPPPYKLPPSY